MSFVYDHVKSLTDDGIGWVKGPIRAVIVNRELAPADFEVPQDAMVKQAEDVPDRTFVDGVASCGRVRFVDVPPGSTVAGVVFLRRNLPLAYITPTKPVEVSPTHHSEVIFAEGEVFHQ